VSRPGATVRRVIEHSTLNPNSRIRTPLTLRLRKWQEKVKQARPFQCIEKILYNYEIAELTKREKKVYRICSYIYKYFFFISLKKWCHLFLGKGGLNRYTNCLSTFNFFSGKLK